MSQVQSIQITSLSNVFNLLPMLESIDVNQDLTLNIEINCASSFIKSEVYVILVSFVNEMRLAGRNVFVNVDTTEVCDAKNYASRMNFFNLLEITYVETFDRRNSSGNFIEITKIEPGVYDLPDRIMNVFENDFNLSKTDCQQLSFIINEMICNSTIHSKSLSGAYLYCQKYRGKRRSLEFILVDSGIGIHNSLKKNPDHSSLTNSEAVSKAIQYEITCGEGRGHGLFFASEFVLRNDGSMLLLSGGDHVNILNGNTNSNTNPNWNGVILKFNFKFDASFSLDDLMKSVSYSNINN